MLSSYFCAIKRTRVIYLATLTLLFAGVDTRAALSPPVIRCIALDDAGNATLHWDKPFDPNNDFSSYKIYYKTTQAGSYSAVAEITFYDTVSHTLPGNYAVGGTFYMVTLSDGGLQVSVPSAIVSPILVSLSAADRDVSATWNAITLPSPDNTYKVHRSIANAPWEWAGDVAAPATSFSETVGVCADTVRYFVQIAGEGGCHSRSNAAKVFVADKTPPARCDLTTASVDTATGAVMLRWAKSASPDVFGYQLNFFSALIYADTVFGGDSLQHTFTGHGINAQMRPETLSVAPFDSCFDSVNSMWYNQAADNKRFSTLFVDTVSFDRCAGKVELKWNMPNDSTPVGVLELSGFRIYRSENGGASALVATLGAEDSVFLDSGLLKGSVYRYVIMARDDGRGVGALSNVFDLSLRPPKAPKQFFVSHIANDHESGNNHVFVATDTTSEIIRYGLFRSSFEVGGFQPVLFVDDSRAQIFSMEDEGGRADQSDFHYWVIGYDYCGDSIASTVVAKSLHTYGFKREADLVNEVEWTTYVGFDAAGSEVKNYALIRQTNDTALDTLISSPNAFFHNDTIFDLSYVGGNVCYYVEAAPVKGSGISRSNLLCTTYDPLIYIPNAFTPDNDGVNDVFLPDVNFIDIFDYELTIYDRSGKYVFRTNDPTLGWDGFDQPSATYVYDLFLKNARGEDVHLSGKVTLVR